MAQIKSWTVSDTFWSKVEPLIPARQRPEGKTFQRKPGAGRKPMEARQIFSAIVYVLRSGCQWKALPREFGSASAIHLMEGIAWRWQSIDGAMGKAPLARECVGSNPTDRGKKRAQAQPAGRRTWSPAVNRRQRSQHA